MQNDNANIKDLLRLKNRRSNITLSSSNTFYNQTINSTFFNKRASHTFDSRTQVLTNMPSANPESLKSDLRAEHFKLGNDKPSLVTTNNELLGSVATSHENVLLMAEEKK